MKVEVQNYKKSIRQIGLKRDAESILWEFYVTKSMVASASQKRVHKDYGISQIPIKSMLKVAGVTKENCHIILANSINKTLKENDLEIIEGGGNPQKNKPIEIGTPKIVCSTPFLISDYDKPKAKCGEGESVLTHIRNSFAHGNTYIFDNNYILLEDLNNGRVTARILIEIVTLFEWIKLIDKDNKFYKIPENYFDFEYDN